MYKQAICKNIHNCSNGEAGSLCMKKSMVLLKEKGHFCSRNYILRALYFLRAHCTHFGQHILCLKCNIRGHSSVM